MHHGMTKCPPCPSRGVRTRLTPEAGDCRGGPVRRCSDRKRASRQREHKSTAVLQHSLYFIRIVALLRTRWIEQQQQRRHQTEVVRTRALHQHSWYSAKNYWAEHVHPVAWHFIDIATRW